MEKDKNIISREEFDAAAQTLHELAVKKSDLQALLNYLEQGGQNGKLLREKEKELHQVEWELMDLQTIFYNIGDSSNRFFAHDSQNIPYNAYLSTRLYQKWNEKGYKTLCGFEDFLGEVAVFMNDFPAEKVHLDGIDYYTYLIGNLRSHSPLGLQIRKHWDCRFQLTEEETAEDMPAPDDFTEEVISRMTVDEIGRELGLSTEMLRVLVYLGGDKVTKGFVDLCNGEIFMPSGKYVPEEEFRKTIRNLQRSCRRSKKGEAVLKR